MRTLLYAGNANFCHVRTSEYAVLLALLLDVAPAETIVIPSVGPTYGMMMDQARVLLDFQCPTAMILPMQEMTTPEGVETGVRHFVEALGRPAILYLKHDGQMTLEGVRRLSDDGLLSAVKYAIAREDPAQDDFLRQLTDIVDPRSVVSGLGEQPAIVHMSQFQLGGFTSGCACIAPRMSTEMLRAIRRGEFEVAERLRESFRPLEDLRNAIHPVCVLHDAVALCGIADTGHMLPLLSNLEDAQRGRVREAAERLLAADRPSADG